jgi:chaperonin cofactor prefoldin
MSEDVIARVVAADRNARAAVALSEKLSIQVGELSAKIERLESMQAATDTRFAPLQGQIARLIGTGATGG